jgi:hypothetical protein
MPKTITAAAEKKSAANKLLEAPKQISMENCLYASVCMHADICIRLNPYKFRPGAHKGEYKFKHLN